MSGFRPHSGITGVMCPDWGNSSDCQERLAGSARDLQCDPFPIDPHIIRCEAPPIICNGIPRLAALVALNPTVLGATRVLLVEGHSGCAGIRAAWPNLGDEQYYFQHTMMVYGAQIAADFLSTLRGEPTQVICSYTWLGGAGKSKVTDSMVVANATGNVGQHTTTGLQLPSGENVPLEWPDPRLNAIYERVRNAALAD